MKPRTHSRSADVAVAALLLLVGLLLFPENARAQGDGPRVMALAPVGLNAVSVTYMPMSSNYNFAQDILIKGADINSDVWAFAYNRFFNVGGRMAEIWLVPVFGTVSGSVELLPGVPPLIPGGVKVPQVDGWADPYVAFRIGLVGAPALKLPEFAKHKPGFSMYALVGANIPIGDYKSTRPVNLGTNRWAFRAAAPMVQAWARPGRLTQLEVTPSVYFYTTNNDPNGPASERSQKPLLVVETHLTQNLTPKFWVGGDLRYQAGGETKTDGRADDNASNHAGGGFEVGYQIARPLAAVAGWGKIFAESDGSRGDMWRFRVIMVF
jgi:hypothetical protein